MTGILSIMKEGEEQDNPTLFEIMKESPDMTSNEATKVQEDLRPKKEGVCITGALKKDIKSSTFEEERQKFKKEIDYHRYWKDMYEKEHKLRQEAETETILVKGIGMNSPEMKKAEARIKELENNRDLDFPMDEIAYNEVKHRVKELENSLSIALEINESHQRYNGKLQTRLTEVEEDNKKLATQVEDQLDRFRKSGGM